MSDPWDTRSPVGAVLAAVLGVAVAVSILTDNGGSAATPAPSPTAAPTAAAATTAPPSPTAAPTTPPAATSAPPQAPPGPDPAAAALDAVRAWQAPTVEARQDALGALAADAFVTAMDGVDPASVPDATPARAETLVESDGLARVAVALADGTPLTVDLELDGARWVLVSILPG